MRISLLEFISLHNPWDEGMRELESGISQNSYFRGNKTLPDHQKVLRSPVGKLIREGMRYLRKCGQEKRSLCHGIMEYH